MNFNILKNKNLLSQAWYFLAVIISLTIILELLFPGLVLVYINPLFFLLLWLILSIYIIFRK